MSPARLGLALCLMVGLGLTTGLGLLLLVPLLQLAGFPIQPGVLDGIVRQLTWIFMAAGIRPSLPAVLTVYVLITALQSLLSRVLSTVSSSLEHESAASLRRRLFAAVSHAEWVFLSQRRSSDLAHVLITETQRAGSATHALLNLAATAVVSIVYVTLAVKLSLPLTALVVSCGVVMMLLLRGRWRVARQAGEDLSNGFRALYAALWGSLPA